jgi:hypothetical protein
LSPSKKKIKQVKSKKKEQKVGDQERASKINGHGEVKRGKRVDKREGRK